jgi:hypothetical protein
MRQSWKKLVLCSLLVAVPVLGCTLIAEVDRSKIPTDDGSGGAGGDSGDE